MAAEDERLVALRLKWVFEDYPELARAMREADYWVGPDGSVHMQHHVEDLAALEPGLRAYAKARNAEFEELPMAAPRPERPPDPPLSMQEAAGVSRTVSRR